MSFSGAPGAIGQRHAVAGLDGGIGGERKDAAAAAGAQDDGLGGNGLDLSGGQLDRDHALHPAVVHQQFGDEIFVVARDGVVFERRLKQRVQHVEAGLVGGKPGALFLHAAERPHRHVSVGLATPGTAPMLQPHQF